MKVFNLDDRLINPTVQIVRIAEALKLASFFELLPALLLAGKNPEPSRQISKRREKEVIKLHNSKFLVRYSIFMSC